MIKQISVFLIILLTVNLYANNSFAFWPNKKKKKQQAIYKQLNEVEDLNKVEDLKIPDPKIQLNKLLCNPNDPKYEKVLELLDSLKDVNEPLGKNNYSALDLALWKHNKTHSLAVIRKLLAMGADVNKIDVSGWTPLLTALSFTPKDSYYDIMLLLLEQNVQINVAIKKSGSTPLMCALKHAPHDKYLDIARLLLDQKAEIYVANQDGTTPLILALRHAPHAAYMTLFHKLLVNKAYIKATNIHSENALCVAHTMNRQDAFTMLLLLGEDTGVCKKPEKLANYHYEMNQIDSYLKASLHQKELVSGFAGNTVDSVEKALLVLHERHPGLVANSRKYYPGLFAAYIKE